MLQKEPAGSAGYWADFFFFFEAVRSSQQQQCGMESASGACFCKGSWQPVSPVQSPAEQNVPGEIARAAALRAIIPSGISGSLLVWQISSLMWISFFFFFFLLRSRRKTLLKDG